MGLWKTNCYCESWKKSSSVCERYATFSPANVQTQRGSQRHARGQVKNMHLHRKVDSELPRRKKSAGRSGASRQALVKSASDCFLLPALRNHLCRLDLLIESKLVPLLRLDHLASRFSGTSARRLWMSGRCSPPGSPILIPHVTECGN
jgi:hypothetical protein